MPKFYKNIVRIYFHRTASIEIVTIFCFDDYISTNDKLIHFSRLFLLFLNTYRYSLSWKFLQIGIKYKCKPIPIDLATHNYPRFSNSSLWAQSHGILDVVPQ